jgi:predicted ferric reductase
MLSSNTTETDVQDRPPNTLLSPGRLLDMSGAGLLGLVLGIGAAGLLGFFAAPLWSQISQLLQINTVESLWYVTRAAGLMAYLLLWLSTVWGLGVASKIFDPLVYRAFTFDVHEFLSLLAIGFTVLHVGVLLADKYVPFTVVQVLIPFINDYRPFWVGMGIIGTYLTLLVTVTFYLRRWIGQKAFRSIHLFSFGSYAAVTLHGIFSGTDTTLGATQLVYVGTALVVGLLTVHYFAVKRGKKVAQS